MRGQWMTFIRMGDEVRRYDRADFDDRDPYDPGEVVGIEDGITVDFKDWSEWFEDDSEFRLCELYFEAGQEVLVLLSTGKVIDDYRHWLR